MAIYMMRDVNTYLAHYPLTSTSTTSDTSGNGKNLTKSGTVTFGTYGGVNCAYFNGGYLYINESLVLGSDPRTINCWYYRTNNAGEGGAFWGMGTASANHGITAYIGTNTDYEMLGYGNWDFDVDTRVSIDNNNWHMLTMTYDGSTLKMYGDHNLISTKSNVTLGLTDTATALAQMPNFGVYKYKGYLSNFIFDGVCWSASDVADYYNQTKSDYGL